jgi:molybdopterin-guanine dinucleotide biosynthesis protein B
MIPIVSIVGKSDSGKTTLIEKLVPELNRKGYRVATVKHDVHSFEVDREGKDSWRHRKAGAHSTVISSPQQLAIIRDMEHDASLEEIRDRFIRDVDIIITEGYKKDSAPKVEVFRKEAHQEPLCTRDDNLVAFVSNKPFDLGVPCLDLNDGKALADLLERTVLTPELQQRVCLKVDGRNVPLKSFTGSFIEETVRGILASLKGCNNPQNIELKIG